MKKNLLSLIGLLTLTSGAFAQVIPNGGFENWTNMGTYSEPDNWGTMNSYTAASSIFTATKGTPGSPGTSYLKLTSKTIVSGVLGGIAVSGVLDQTAMLPKSGFGFTQRPTALTGKWQHMVFGTSQGSVSVLLTRWNSSSNQRVTVASIDTTLNGMEMAWVNFSLNFKYVDSGNPDTCIIVLKASGATPANNDYLWVDNLSFSGIGAGIKENYNSSNLKLFPNPASDNLNIEYTDASMEPITMELMDVTGKVVISKKAINTIGTNDYSLNVANFAKGIYFLKVSSDRQIETKKIIVR